MFDKNKNNPLDQARKANEGFFMGIYNNLRLIVRLLKDDRVSPLLKLLPIGALIYLVIPVDFFPINPIDDGLVIWLGGYLFIELCPDEIVREHKDALRQVLTKEEDIRKSPQEVIDGEYKDIFPKD